MYCGDHEHYDFMNEAFGLFAHVNVLQRDMCPSATKFEAEIVSMALDLFHAGAVTDATQAGPVFVNAVAPEPTETPWPDPTETPSPDPTETAAPDPTPAPPRYIPRQLARQRLLETTDPHGWDLARRLAVIADTSTGDRDTADWVAATLPRPRPRPTTPSLIWLFPHGGDTAAR